MKVLICLGTRPELIKMCTVIKALKESKQVECLVCMSGQHRELAESVVDELGIKIDYNLNIMRKKQTLQYVLAAVVEKMQSLLESVKPDYIIVHGDTSTCFASALCSFYEKIPIVYVEAGWRSSNINIPFPEEMHRRIVSKVANYFLCSTEENYNNLIAEGVSKEHIFVTGNPINDILQQTLSQEYHFSNEVLNRIVVKKYILITFHRRENRKKVLDLYRIICKIAEEHKELEFIWVCHPSIKDILDVENNMVSITLVPPLGIYDMHNLIYRACIIITDSGGVQEEAYILKRNIIILRECLERTELLNECSVLLEFKESTIREYVDFFLEGDVNTLHNLVTLSNYSIGSRIGQIIEDICCGKS